RLVLGLIQFYRASLNFLPYVLGLLLVVLCLLWAGIVNGLRLLGIAVICSALSFLLLAKVAEVIIFLPLARSWGGSEILALLFNDGPTVLSSAVGITVTELIKVSLVYGTAGCVLLTAGLAAGMVRRRSGSVK
ncbi:MAG TPA: hypothetical protein VLH18_07435, partial [Candidatus Limnocylindrales bacterium]|nr:hypothetical protein [Candidatus Limnocylindrales bacterium]